MTYYVAFWDSGERHWWSFMNRTGFEHVDVFYAVSDFRTVGIVYDKTGLHATYHNGSPEALMQKVLQRRDCTCVIEVVRESRAEYAARGMLNCVSAVKAALGMGWCTAITPHQLAKRLMRDGGVLHHGWNFQASA